MTISNGTLTKADGYNKIESTIPFPNLCCTLSLSYRFPGCGYTAQEGLGLFLRRIHEKKKPRRQKRHQDYFYQNIELNDGEHAPAPAFPPTPPPNS